MQRKASKNISKFKEKVIQVVNLISFGKVMSYGQVALYVGIPRAARQVGWILNGLGENTLVPWWRVVNNKGRISIKGSRYSDREQKELLLKEKIDIKDDLTFEIEKYRFMPSEAFIKKLGLDPMYLDMVSQKIPFSDAH